MKADFMFSDFQGWKILTLQKKKRIYTLFSLMYFPLCLIYYGNQVFIRIINQT